MWKTFRSPLSRLRVLAPLALSLPLAIGVEVPPDSSLTQVRVGGGGGSYLAVVRDCNGNVLDERATDFTSVGASIEHSRNQFVVGVHGGYIDDGRGFVPDTYPLPSTLPPSESFFYLSPQLGMNTARAGFTVGFVYSSRPMASWDDTNTILIDGNPLAFTRSQRHYVPSAALRLGNPASLYVSAHWLSLFPLYSGGDYSAIGMGGRPFDGVNLWGGIGGGGPYAHGGALLMGEIALTDRVWFGLQSRFGRADEYGLGVSLTFRGLSLTDTSP